MVDCTHDNWILQGNEYIGMCTCTDCKQQIWLSVAFNRLHDRMNEALERINKMADYINTIPKTAPKIKGQQKKQKQRKVKG